MKKVVLKTLMGAIALACFMSPAMQKAPKEAAAKTKVKKVTTVAPSGKTAYVAKGKKIKLATTVKVKPNKKANKKVVYKSANKKIASVSSKGVVKGKKAGKTKITVISKKNKKKKAVIKVVVKKAAVKKVKLNTKNFVLSAGGSRKLKATATPKKNTCTKVVWSSSNKKIATVSSKGVVKAKKDGKAKITAKAADGSGKKASATVTVGAGIAGVTVVSDQLIRVSLTSKKALNASHFTVQTKSGPSSSKYITRMVSNVSTTDQKVYNVNLEDEIQQGCYVKVTISALVSNRSAEIYVSNIYSYGDATNESVVYETGNKDTMGQYDEYWNISNTNRVGEITYSSVSGLPSGLKAYISKDRTSVRVRGKFNNIENGTIAVLTGVDERGSVFTQKYIFVIGSNERIVAVAEPPATELSYRPDDPKTVKDEESGFYLTTSAIAGFVHVGGGGSWERKVTYNGKSLDSLIYDEDGYRKPVNAGTYQFNVQYQLEDNEKISVSVPVTIHLQDGVTVSGMVRDAANQPAREVNVSGYTKSDAYGRYNRLSATTEADGTYSTRVLAGDYCTYVSWGYNPYDMTSDNRFYGTATKNFTLPLYRVTFGINVPQVVGYSSPYIKLIDSYGSIYSVNNYSNSYDRDHSMIAYLKAGSYELENENDASVYAYGGLDEDIDKYGNKHYYLTESMGEYKIAPISFQVGGSTNIMLNATKMAENEEE